jgi:hypothetical protein
VIFSGIGVLLQVSIFFSFQLFILTQQAYQAAKDVGASMDALVLLFRRIENFFQRIQIYSEVRQTEAMTEFIVKVVVDILDILAIATKEIRQGSASESTC